MVCLLDDVMQIGDKVVVIINIFQPRSDVGVENIDVFKDYKHT
jgi:hypothetical protein